MSAGTTRFAAWLMVAMTCFGMAAVLNEEPAGWSQDMREGDCAWTMNADGSVAVTFSSPIETPVYSGVTLLADATDQGRFSGDFDAEKVRGISFRLKTNGQRPKVALAVLVGTSGRLWFNTGVRYSEVADQWVDNIVSVETINGWNTLATGDKAMMWAEDIRNVAMVGVRLSQSSPEQQVFTVDDFKLVAQGSFTPLELAVLERFGHRLFDLNEAQKRIDSDHDGMADYQELLAGVDPDVRQSVFRSRLGNEAKGSGGSLDVGVQGGFTLAWPCVAGGNYSVLRSADLKNYVEIVTLDATGDGELKYTDREAAVTGPYFYKIRKN